MSGELKHVVIIDDEPDVVAVAQMSLETVGNLTVTTANNGMDGIKVLEQTKPDVILLDVMMPGMDGPTTFKVLRGLPELNDIPVIFMTARVRPSEVDEYLALGANGVIPKPFDPMQLTAQVTEIWERFHAK